MLTFLTPGTFPLAALTAFGVSSKPDSESPIGKFGTGLKYALAGIKRLGGEVTIHSPEGDWFVDVESDTLRGKDFQRLTLVPTSGPNLPLPFSTDLGHHWEPWMLYRELWSNTKDEGGKVGEDLPTPEGWSCISVDCPELLEAHAERSSFLLDPDLLLSIPGRIEIHRKNFSGNSYFYRGIKVGETNEPCAFAYNILSANSLTEDRTLGEFNLRWELQNFLPGTSNSALIGVILGAEDETYESSLEFTSPNPSDEFILAAQRAGKRKHLESLETYSPERIMGDPCTLTSTQNHIATEVWEAAKKICGKSIPFPKFFIGSRTQAIHTNDGWHFVLSSLENPPSLLTKLVETYGERLDLARWVLRELGADVPEPTAPADGGDVF